MLYKIKTLRELIETKASVLGISFEEILNMADDNIKCDILLNELFGGKLVKTNLIYCFDIEMFNDISSNRFYFIPTDIQISKFNQRSLKYANEYNIAQRGKKKSLFFNVELDSHPLQTKEELAQKNKVYVIKKGQIYLTNSRWWGNPESDINFIKNKFNTNNKYSDYILTYKRLINNNANVDNYLLVIDTPKKLKEYEHALELYSPDSYNFNNCIKQIIYKQILEILHPSELKQLTHADKFQKVSIIQRDFYLYLKKIKKHSLIYDIQSNVNHINDLKHQITEIIKLFNIWLPNFNLPD